MGIYVVTGGTKGIGEKTVEYLRDYGHEVINVDIVGGDINVDLGTSEGRKTAIKEIHVRCPDGLDGLVSNAGIAGLANVLPSKVLSVNYFGAVELMEGVYNLLKMKKGNCVVTVSGTIAYIKRGKGYVDALLTNCGDEERICKLVDSFDRNMARNTMYGSTKIALTHWMRRVAPSWATHGVNINAVAPGAIATTIMGGSMPENDNFLLSLPMPTVYNKQYMMDPDDVGEALAFMVLPRAKGFSGAVLFCDGGTAAILDSDKVY